MFMMWDLCYRLPQQSQRAAQFVRLRGVLLPGRVQGEPRQSRPECQHGRQLAQGQEMDTGWTRQLPCLHRHGTAGGLHGLLPKVESLRNL